MIDRLYSNFLTGMVKHTDIAIGQKIGVKHRTLNVQQEGLVFAQEIRGNCAFGTLAIVCASH